MWWNINLFFIGFRTAQFRNLTASKKLSTLIKKTLSYDLTPCTLGKHLKSKEAFLYIIHNMLSAKSLYISFPNFLQLFRKSKSWHKKITRENSFLTNFHPIYWYWWIWQNIYICIYVLVHIHILWKTFFLSFFFSLARQMSIQIIFIGRLCRSIYECLEISQKKTNFLAFCQTRMRYSIVW